jgi:hypothetical protein
VEEEREEEERKEEEREEEEEHDGFGSRTHWDH